MAQKGLNKLFKGRSPILKFSTTVEIAEKVNEMAKITGKTKSQVINEIFVEAEPMIDAIIAQYKKITQMKEDELKAFNDSLEAKREHLEDVMQEIKQPTFFEK